MAYVFNVVPVSCQDMFLKKLINKNLILIQNQKGIKDIKLNQVLMIVVSKKELFVKIK